MSHCQQTRITKTVVDALLPNECIRDTELVGFGVRRQKGPAVYFLQKRIGAKVRWITIGRHGSPWTPDMARKEAYRLLGRIADGQTPVTRQHDHADRPTLAMIAPRFLAEHGAQLKPSSLEKYRYLIAAYILPELGDRHVVTLVRADILKLHARMRTTPTLANYCVSVLSKLLSWCEEHDIRSLQSNPAFRLKKYRERKRQRYLTREEFARLGAVLDRVETFDRENFFIVAAIRLLLLTGARVGEIRSLTWKMVDFERRVLLLPDSKTGQKVIRLNPQALSVLEILPRIEGNPYIIIGRREGAHIVNLEKPGRRIRVEAGLDDVRLHDLRHSFASVAAASRGSLPMIGRLLGHSHVHTTARYAHLASDPVDELNARVGETISAALSGHPAGSQ